MEKFSKFLSVALLSAAVLAPAAWAANYADPAMTDAFVDLTAKNRLTKDFANTPFELQQFDGNYICIKQRIKNALSMGHAEDIVASYSSDSEGDLIARKYVEVAKARGNLVRVYNPNINQIICKKFYHPAKHFAHTREWYKTDRALIEFDKSGRIVSFMARAVQAGKGIGAVVHQYTSIYLGPQNARDLENVLNNRVLQDNFLREL